jgi:hypothetical protein
MRAFDAGFSSNSLQMAAGACSRYLQMGWQSSMLAGISSGTCAQ